MKKIWYTGLRLPDELAETCFHLPLIKTLPKVEEILQTASLIGQYTTLIFTSRTAVELFFRFGLKIKKGTNIFAVGKKTGALLSSHSPIISAEETAEGLIACLEARLIGNEYLLWPHSSLSRPLIANYLQKKNAAFHAPVFYETITVRLQDPPRLGLLDKVIFTSPSTVKGFFTLYDQIPNHLELETIGPVTKKSLESYL